MSAKRSIPFKLALGLGLAIALDTAVQVSWKAAVSTVPASLSGWDLVMEYLHRPVFLAVVVMLGLQLINWIKVLDHADLSYAQPITSLSYVSVCLFSAFLLKEPIDALQLTGIGFVLAGVWFISRTDPATGSGQDPAA